MIDTLRKLFGGNTGYTTLNDTEFQDKFRTAKKPIIIDVRSKSEFSQEKIPNALNIDIFSPNFNDRIKNLDPNRPMFVYCQSGMRSRRACKRMVKAGVQEVYNLKGGMKNFSGKVV